VFAPRTGAPLLVGAGLLVLLTLLSALAVLPRTPALLALFGAGGALWAFLLVFFRDPERPLGSDIVSAADGHVLSVGEEAGRVYVRVFMGVTDVHVNRFPLDGTVTDVEEGGRGFHPAYGPFASLNVYRRYRLSTRLGPVELVQITGFFARRLVSFVKAGETRAKGDRLGMIVLGSRFDAYFPADRVTPLVSEGQPVRAGVTAIARERP
jgi:phosphatidylserine decarboxylase